MNEDEKKLLKELIEDEDFDAEEALWDLFVLFNPTDPVDKADPYVVESFGETIHILRALMLDRNFRGGN